MTTKAQTKFSNQALQEAFNWLCQQRKNFPSSSDVWSLQAGWDELSATLLHQINSGQYCFSPLSVITKSNGQTIHLWCSQDALVMKLLSNQLTTMLRLSDQCVHVKGNGGLKSAINQTQQALSTYQFVCKTDVKSFYESMNQHILMKLVDQQISCKLMRRYLWQVVTRVIDKGGNIIQCKQGISRGSALSPILGALYLNNLDIAFKRWMYFT